MVSGRLLAGRYVVGRAVGVGGMGKVLAGVDTLLGRDVAIKTFALTGAYDAVALERFRREARAAAGLQHPNVVTIFDTGVDGDLAFLVMELLPGPDLAAHMAAQGPWPEEEVLDLAAQVAAGLSAAHGAGVIHRDIKPANLVFDADGSLRIVDFGIARLEHTPSDLTKTQTVIGSAHYLSPEQLEGRPADARSDLYALGCVMTTMLTGRPPFDGEHPLAVAHQHLTARPPAILERRPGVTPALDALVNDLLAKSPDDRPQTAAIVTERLRSLAGAGLGSAAAPVPPRPAASTDPIGAVMPSISATRALPSVSPTQPLPVPPAPTPAGASSEAPPDSRRGRLAARRRRRNRGLVAAGVALAVALVAFFVSTLGDGGAPPGVASRLTSPPAASTAPSSPTPSESRTSPTPSRTPTPTDTRSPLTKALDELNGAVEAALSSGNVDDRSARTLSQRLSDLQRRAEQNGGGAAKKRIESMTRYVESLAEHRELTNRQAERILAALDKVDEAVDD